MKAKWTKTSPLMLGVFLQSQSVQSRTLTKSFLQHLPKDQITYPHFNTISKKTIMVLFPEATQDH